jgi:hypothetical protein
LACPHFRWRGWQKPYQRHHGDRFSRPAFTHHTQNLAALQSEADGVDSVDLTLTRVKNGRKPPYIQNGRGLVGHGNLPEMSNFLIFFLGGSALPLSS